jgi:mannose-6-phosphate isomerase class I
MAVMQDGYNVYNTIHEIEQRNTRTNHNARLLIGTTKFECIADFGTKFRATREIFYQEKRIELDKQIAVWIVHTMAG